MRRTQKEQKSNLQKNIHILTDQQKKWTSDKLLSQEKSIEGGQSQSLRLAKRSSFFGGDHPVFDPSKLKTKRTLLEVSNQVHSDSSGVLQPNSTSAPDFCLTNNINFFMPKKLKHDNQNSSQNNILNQQIVQKKSKNTIQGP